MEDCAGSVANYLLETELMDHVEFSERSDGFKIKLEMKKFPKDISVAVKKSTRDMNTIFGGAKLRVKFLSSTLLESSTISKMKDLLQTLEKLTQDLVTERQENLQDYSNLFYGYANGDSVIFGGSELSDETNSQSGYYIFIFVEEANHHLQGFIYQI